MSEEEKDWYVIAGLAVVFVMSGGLSMVAAQVFPSVQDFLSGVGVLVPAEEAVFTLLDTGVGLSSTALLVALGLLCLLIVIGPRRKKDGDRG